MPFSTEHKVIYGDDAKQPELYARTAFCDWLRALLNDPSGSYYSQLSLSPTRLVVVTENKKITRSKYTSKSSPPVVFAHKAVAADWMRGGAIIDGETHDGKRYDIEIYLDMGIKDATPNAVDVVAEERDEAVLGAIVRNAVRDNCLELGNLLGLNNPELTQDEGKGVMPHCLTCFCIALDSWTP